MTAIKKAKSNTRSKMPVLQKAPTGIEGLDQITGGGLPKNRPTLVTGSAGSGKTLLAMQFLICGITEYQEPGIFVAFEETPDELAENVASLGFNLYDLMERQKLIIEDIQINRSEIQEVGGYDLEALFVRLGFAIDSIGAKRIVFDTIEMLFALLTDDFTLRSEMRRLFRWLKSKGITAIVTAERGDGQLTRHGLEEYVSDCVISLDQRVVEQISTRRLRIVKYRGTAHGTNEYPFLIDEHGFSVMPITSLGLEHTASTERISSGIPELDEALGGGGYYRSSSILVSGTAGGGKTSVASAFADATCRRGERCLYIASEESSSQIINNMHSIGLNLQPWIDKGLLRFHTVRPTVYGLEMHLIALDKLVSEFMPQVVIVDPTSNFNLIGTPKEIKAMLIRMVDSLKMQHITSLFTNLIPTKDYIDADDVGVSSIIDTWLLLSELEANGERNRLLNIVKSRGMAHSNQVREFVLSSEGIKLMDVYLGPSGVLTGSARIMQEAQENATLDLREQELANLKLNLDRKRKLLEAQIAALEAEFNAQADEVNHTIQQWEFQEQRRIENRAAMASSRRVDGHEKKS